jgi:hypothetical protein
VVALTATLLLGSAPHADAYPSSYIEFEGHGWGHGRGLGQYGALGYAVDEGQSYATILDHFYGGTRKGTKPDGIISVRLTAFDGTTTAPKDFIVRSAGAFTLASQGEDTIAAGTAVRVRYSAAGWLIEQSSSCSGPWTSLRTVPTSVNVEARTAYTGDDINQMLNLCSASETRAYRGSVMFRLINE